MTPQGPARRLILPISISRSSKAGRGDKPASVVLLALAGRYDSLLE
jgi:hypothetical protein